MSAGFASDWEQSDRAQMQAAKFSAAGQELQISPIGTCRSDRKTPIQLSDHLTVNLLASSPTPYISPARTNGMSNFDSVVTSPGISSSLSPEPEPGRLPTELAQLDSLPGPGMNLEPVHMLLGGSPVPSRRAAPSASKHITRSATLLSALPSGLSNSVKILMMSPGINASLSPEPGNSLNGGRKSNKEVAPYVKESLPSWESLTSLSGSSGSQMGSPHRAVLNQPNDNESDEIDFDVDEDMDEEIILTKEAADYEFHDSNEIMSNEKDAKLYARWRDVNVPAIFEEAENDFPSLHHKAQREAEGTERQNTEKQNKERLDKERREEQGLEKKVEERERQETDRQKRLKMLQQQQQQQQQQGLLQQQQQQQQPSLLLPSLENSLSSTQSVNSRQQQQQHQQQPAISPSSPQATRELTKGSPLSHFKRLPSARVFPSKIVAAPESSPTICHAAHAQDMHDMVEMEDHNGHAFHLQGSDKMEIVMSTLPPQIFSRRQAVPSHADQQRQLDGCKKEKQTQPEESNTKPSPKKSDHHDSSMSEEEREGHVSVNMQNQSADKVFGCIFKCDFMGGFQEVSAHESTCTLNPVLRQALELPDTQRKAKDREKIEQQEAVTVENLNADKKCGWICDFQCGFVGGFDEVSAHEPTCTLNPAVSTGQPPNNAPALPSIHWASRLEKAMMGFEDKNDMVEQNTEIIEKERLEEKKIEERESPEMERQKNVKNLQQQQQPHAGNGPSTRQENSEVDMMGFEDKDDMVELEDENGKIRLVPRRIAIKSGGLSSSNHSDRISRLVELEDENGQIHLVPRHIAIESGGFPSQEYMKHERELCALVPMQVSHSASTEGPKARRNGSCSSCSLQ